MNKLTYKLLFDYVFDCQIANDDLLIIKHILLNTINLKEHIRFLEEQNILDSLCKSQKMELIETVNHLTVPNKEKIDTFINDTLFILFGLNRCYLSSFFHKHIHQEPEDIVNYSSLRLISFKIRCDEERVNKLKKDANKMDQVMKMFENLFKKIPDEDIFINEKLLSLSRSIKIFIADKDIIEVSFYLMINIDNSLYDIKSLFMNDVNRYLEDYEAKSHKNKVKLNNKRFKDDFLIPQLKLHFYYKRLKEIKKYYDKSIKNMNKGI